MPPAAVISAVPPMPATRDPRAAAAAVNGAADANAAEPAVAGGFGHALGEAMKNLDKTPGASRKSAGEWGQDIAQSVLSVPAEVQDPVPGAGIPPAVSAILAPPAQAPAAGEELVLASDAPVASGGAAPSARIVPTGKNLPPADQALPRAASGAPATALGGAQDALARPDAALADISLVPSRGAESPLLVATGARGVIAATEISVDRPGTGATPPAMPVDANHDLPPGLVEVAPRHAAQAAMQAPHGRVAADAPPLPTSGLEGALDRAVARADATPESGANGNDEAAPRDAAAVAVASAPRADAGAPGAVAPAADPGEPAMAGLRVARARDKAETTPGVAMPVTGSLAVAPPEPSVARGDGATDVLVASVATLRHRMHAPAPQGAHHGATGAVQVNAQASDNTVAPWLQMLTQARELAAEPGQESLDMDGAGPLPVVVGERGATAGPVLQASSIAGVRADGGAGPGMFAAPLTVGQAGPEWAGELEARVQWLAGRNLRSAEIQLDPPELGPLQVQVQAHRDGASVHFTTHSAAVRDLVEQSLPRLREMLESSGMNLVDVNVAQQQGGRGEPEASPASLVGAAMRGEAQATDVATAVEMSPRGLVDAYA